MGRILDFYAVRWEYEPQTFPILWNLDGDVVESFAPDFYLPDLDIYLEMTTLKQRLVRKKNRKLRRLRELYPDVRIKLFYARDFRALMLKYGKLALVDALSGAPGQVATPHLARVGGAVTVGVTVPLSAAAAPVAASSAESIQPTDATSGAATARRSRSARRRRAAAARRAAVDVVLPPVALVADAQAAGVSATVARPGAR